MGIDPINKISIIIRILFTVTLFQQFVLIFVDDFSRFTWIYFLRQKSEVFQHLKDFKALVETQSGKKIKVLRTDNGGEYVNHEIHNLCHEAGIQWQHTVPYTP
jgi:transposase InsO family protein